jgi:hypothetical protein
MTTETKHTPGPWQQYSEWEPLRIVGNIDGPDDGRMHYTTVCEVELTEDDTFRANARLIATAPTLLKALQSASDWIDAQLGVPRTEIQAIVQRAIAEAEGVEPTLAA